MCPSSGADDCVVIALCWYVTEINYKMHGATIQIPFSPLNTKLTPICHLLALSGTHHILHISGIRVIF
jgi:hypothetical protein